MAGSLSGMVGVVVGLVSVVLAGCNKWVVAAMLMVAMIGSPATLSSFTLTPMDIAPNYAGESVALWLYCVCCLALCTLIRANSWNERREGEGDVLMNIWTERGMVRK